MSKAQKSYGKNMHTYRAMLLILQADEKIHVEGWKHPFPFKLVILYILLNL